MKLVSLKSDASRGACWYSDQVIYGYGQNLLAISEQ